MENTFSSFEVVRLSGVTYRQVDYWCRLGVLQPLGGACPGYGAHRRFSETEVAIAAVCAQLAYMGATVADVCQRVAAQLRPMWDAMHDGVTQLYVTPSGEVSLEPCAPGWVVDLGALQPV